LHGRIHREDSEPETFADTVASVNSCSAPATRGTTVTRSRLERSRGGRRLRVLYYFQVRFSRVLHNRHPGPDLQEKRTASLPILTLELASHDSKPVSAVTQIVPTSGYRLRNLPRILIDSFPPAWSTANAKDSECFLTASSKEFYSQRGVHPNTPDIGHIPAQGLNTLLFYP
jgi:hypothetical protein